MRNNLFVTCVKPAEILRTTPRRAYIICTQYNATTRGLRVKDWFFAHISRMFTPSFAHAFIANLYLLFCRFSPLSTGPITITTISN